VHFLVSESDEVAEAWRRVRHGSSRSASSLASAAGAGENMPIASSAARPSAHRQKAVTEINLLRLSISIMAARRGGGMAYPGNKASRGVKLCRGYHSMLIFLNDLRRRRNMLIMINVIGYLAKARHEAIVA
jgi:hypothetical protein